MSSAVPASAGRAVAPPAVPPNPTVAAAVVLATMPGGPAGAAALLPWADETVLERLLDQLASLGVPQLHVVVRPAAAAAVAHLVEARAGTRVHVAADSAADLRVVADVAREGTGGLVIAQGEVVTQREALAGLLADPRVATGVLSTGGRVARPFGYRIRTRRGRVVSAASPFHACGQPNSTFLGFLKVAAADRQRLADVAERLAALREAPPADWRREVEVVKPGSWKVALAQMARLRAAREAAGLPPEADDERAAEVAAREAEAQAELDPEGYAAEDDGEGRDRLHPDDVELVSADESELELRVRAAPHDVASLLLVGLTRDGAAIGTSRLRTLFWARPLDEAGVLEARERITHHDEDRALLDAAVKANDGFFTTFFVSPYSQYIARWCARRGLTPNQVTTFSMVLGLLAAAAFATGQRWGLVTGALVLQAAFTFDCVDGQLARYTRTFSKLGAWLDSVFDRAKEYVVFAGLAIGASQTGDDVWVLACAALALQIARHSIDFSYPAAQHQVIGATHQPPLERAADGVGHDLPWWLREPRDTPAGPDGATPAAGGTEPGPAPLPFEPASETPPASAPRNPSPMRRALRLWRQLGRRSQVRWAKKAAIFPIGERFAAISLSAALFDARMTFTVLLVWGGFAAAYILGGRLLRSVRSAAFVAPPGTPDRRLEVYRDDGPIARALGAALGRAVPLAPVVLAGAGLAAVLAAIALGGDGASDLAAALVMVGALVLAGTSAGRPHRDRLRWTVPPLIRLIEYVGIIWLATLVGADAVPAAFALLAAIAFRHYDVVYRLRQRGEEAPPWLRSAALGWDGRLLVVLVLALAVAQPAALWVAAAVFGALVVGEAVYSWASFNRTQRVPVYDDEEEEVE